MTFTVSTSTVSGRRCRGDSTMTAYIDLDGDSVEIKLDGAELALISQIPDVVASLGDGEDPAMERLHPPVAPGDPGADQTWWELVGEDLVVSRNRDALFIAEHVSPDQNVTLRLDAEQAETMLRSVNHARLIIAARLGVTYTDDAGVLEGQNTDVIDFLGWMVEMLTDSLSRLRFAGEDG
ncbi:MAG: DUF2017 family protein [Acidimicrobiia bacterium]|nr:DUF2017 family protein [Acidimicrobiia bacterium]